MKKLAFFVLFLVCGCDNPAPGEACTVTGDGFTRQDPCADTCVEWGVTCPDGAEVTPDVCSDGPCNSDADCGDGWVCLEINMTDSECLPADICPDSAAEAAPEGYTAPLEELGESPVSERLD